ncbi:Hypothetical predicted protein [Podarcis lilfordi]|uniref:Uncharacterized protein n=1 Tax=Podarcis lilfordi TaxID=74358 RepID=A0AA35KIM0_9SAUR|nr:Hypothetical predicted protein [Podarcis lilfordi]
MIHGTFYSVAPCGFRGSPGLKQGWLTCVCPDVARLQSSLITGYAGWSQFELEIDKSAKPLVSHPGFKQLHLQQPKFLFPSQQILVTPCQKVSISQKAQVHINHSEAFAFDVLQTCSQ